MGLYNGFHGFKIAFMTHKKTFKKKKHKNEEEKYILAVVWMVGLIKHCTMNFTNIKLPK